MSTQTPVDPEQDHPDIQTHYQVQQFYHHEAALLDNYQLDDWNNLLADDLHYEMPRRVTREKQTDLPEYVNQYYYRENKESINTRIKRLKLDSAWTINPLPRIRRYITNLRITNQQDNTLDTNTYQLVFTAQGEQQPILLSMQRNDTIRKTTNGYQITDRQILTDHTTLPIANLSLFF